MACRENSAPKRVDSGPNGSSSRSAVHDVQRVDWRVLPWQDRHFASLRDGPRARLVIRDSSTYARRWREVTGDTARPPSVDFQKRFVILLAAPSQTRGSYGLVVDSVFVRPGSDTVNVSVREISPGPHCMLPDDGSRPILAGTIPITAGVVNFLERRSESDCQP
jgi:hypothetical protein